MVVAERETSPESVVTSAPRIKASTSLLISLKAPATPIATETPVPPLNAAATEAAPTTTEILEESSAISETLSAVITLVPVSVMNDLTWVAIRFSAPAPAPLTDTAFDVPPEAATEPAITMAFMLCIDRASIVRAPSESIPESTT